MRRAWILIIMLLVPVIEIAVVVRVGQEFGAPLTIGLLLAVTLFGAWLVKREGARAWRALREATTTGVLPATELTDAALILIGGTLLVTPGFVTDIIGLFFVLPFTRPMARGMVQTLIGRQVMHLEDTVRRQHRGTGGHPGAGGPPGSTGPGSPDRAPHVVRGEVIED
ncbi:MAG: FxsA family protein [Actinomycetota bacterium]|nr:FxsA family protein [Actinomycetota bacterium]